MAGAGMGLGMGMGEGGEGIADQFVSTEDLTSANAVADATANAARDAATDAAGQAEFDPRLEGVEEEERLVEELVTWMEERGVRGIRGEEAAVEVLIDANTTLKASGRSRANLCMVARRPKTEGEVELSHDGASPHRGGRGVSVAASLALSASHALEEAKPYEGEVHPFTALAAWVLRERAKGRASLWAPFVCVLPAHLPFPHLFSDRLRTELQSQSLLMATAEHKRMLSEEYKKCRPEAIADATEEEFLWAVGMVTSRIFTLRTSNSTASGDDSGGSSSSSSSSSSSAASNGTETVLFPYADLFDTDNAPVAMWQGNDTNITFTATGNISLGQHVSVESGLLANDEALLSRGMALLTNYRDSVDVFDYPEVAIDFFGRHYFRTHWESFMEGVGGGWRYGAEGVGGMVLRGLEVWYGAEGVGGMVLRGLEVPWYGAEGVGGMVLRGLETDVEQVFADMEKALKAEVTKDRYKGIPDEPEFRIDTQASLRVWFGGRLDPRLLGGLAALHAHVMNKEGEIRHVPPSSLPVSSFPLDSSSPPFFISPSLLLPLSLLPPSLPLPLSLPLPPSSNLPHSPRLCSTGAASAPDYAALARPVVEYSWLQDPKTTCDDYAASLPDNLGDAIPAAGAGILERAKQMLKAMGTSFEGDMQRMFVVQACKVQVLYGTYPGDKPLMCPPEFVREMPDWEAALAYRLSKKEVLLHVIARLTATCEA
ncbi:unnamed protein product [Closterium sp. Naga37s-1]|nr:unnamed protein product [Closterium sp. Naga37s-1]